MRWSFSTIPSADPRPPTGILGGTFDPIHLGHLSAATQLKRLAGLAEVWLMPNARPPHRASPPLAAPIDRLRMVELAATSVDGVLASGLEVERGGVSYTIDTLWQLREAQPDRPVTFLLGSDAALQIKAWHRARELLEEASFVVFSRPDVRLEPGQLEQLGFAPARTRMITLATPAISGRMVRERLAQGQPVEDLLAPPVAQYIRDHALYRPSNRMG